MTQQTMCFNVEEIKIENRKASKKDNTKAEWEELEQIFRENKKKQKKTEGRRDKFRRKEAV